MDEHDEQERIELDRELNPIIVPTTLYEFFMANGREGLEAMQLWLHLVYMARRQATNQVWAQDTYLQTGLDWGERKIRTLRSWLQKHGLIEYVEPRRNQRGQFVKDEAAKPNKRYIRVKASSQYLQSTETADTAYAENRTCGNDGQVLEGDTGSASKKKGRGEAPVFSEEDLKREFGPITASEYLEKVRLHSEGYGRTIANPAAMAKKWALEDGYQIIDSGVGTRPPQPSNDVQLWQYRLKWARSEGFFDEMQAAARQALNDADYTEAHRSYLSKDLSKLRDDQWEKVKAVTINQGAA